MSCGCLIAGNLSAAVRGVDLSVRQASLNYFALVGPKKLRSDEPQKGAEYDGDVNRCIG